VPPSPARGRVPPSPARAVPPPTPMRVSQHRTNQIREAILQQQQPAPNNSIGKPNNEEDATSLLPEDDGSVDSDPIDEAKVKKLVTNFDKKMLKNQELRIKFPDDPRKFYESEMALHEAVQELHTLTVAPHLYPLLPSLPPSLLSLLGHDNTDIAAAMLDLLQEMTTLDGSNTTDAEADGLDALVDALLASNIVSTLVHNLSRLDDPVSQPLHYQANTLEAGAVHNTLAVIENLVEVRPDTCSIAGPSGLLGWLLKKLRAKVPFDPNKLYASEILAICVQDSDSNRQQVGEMEGVDVILQQLATYKRHDPNTQEEQEMMENLFDVLCSCLLLGTNRQVFLKGEGLQLMNLMLREKKLSRNGAVRVLDHTLTGSEGLDCCNKFVDILGLRTVFPLFMKTPTKHGKRGLKTQEHEGHMVSIIFWLLKNCRAAQRGRVLSKFSENDHEKVDRLLELHFAYLERSTLTDKTVERMQAKQKQAMTDQEAYLRRLDGGLFTLQMVDYIMMCVCATGPPSVKKRVTKILSLRQASQKAIKSIIREYVSNMGDGDDALDDEISEEQNQVLDWLDKFQN